MYLKCLSYSCLSYLKFLSLVCFIHNEFNRFCFFFRVDLNSLLFLWFLITELAFNDRLNRAQCNYCVSRSKNRLIISVLWNVQMSEKFVFVAKIHENKKTTLQRYVYLPFWCRSIHFAYLNPDHLVFIEAQLKTFRHAPSRQRERAPRYGLTVTHGHARRPIVCVKGGPCRRGDGCMPPRASCPRGNDKGKKGMRVRCVFTRLGLRGLWGGERVGREEIESRERRGSRKSGPESVDCEALARWDQSPYIIRRMSTCVRNLSRDENFKEPDTREIALFAGYRTMMSVLGGFQLLSFESLSWFLLACFFALTRFSLSWTLLKWGVLVRGNWMCRVSDPQHEYSDRDRESDSSIEKLNCE